MTYLDSGLFTLRPNTTVEIPESVASAFITDHNPDALSRWALEALVVEAVRERLVSRGKGGEILGLGFHEREQFYADHGVVYDFTEEELDDEQASLDHMFDRR